MSDERPSLEEVRAWFRARAAELATQARLARESAAELRRRDAERERTLEMMRADREREHQEVARLRTRIQNLEHELEANHRREATSNAANAALIATLREQISEMSRRLNEDA